MVRTRAGPRTLSHGIRESADIIDVAGKTQYMNLLNILTEYLYYKFSYNILCPDSLKEAA
jgi:hypothetical protein